MDRQSSKNPAKSEGDGIAGDHTTDAKTLQPPLDAFADLWFTDPMFDAASGDKRADFASDQECVSYWLSYCRDALGRAAEIRRAKRGLNDEMRARRL